MRKGTETHEIKTHEILNRTFLGAFNLNGTFPKDFLAAHASPIHRSFGSVFIYRSIHGKPYLVLPRGLMILRSRIYESHQRIHKT